MVHLIRATLSILIASIVGYALVLFIFRAKPIRNVGLSFALSLGLGFGFLTECCLIYLTLAKRIDFRIIYVALIVAIIGILYAKRELLARRLLSPSYLREIPRKVVVSGRPASQEMIIIAGTCIIAVTVIVVSFNLLARPMYQFDSRAVWGQKAQILFYERTIFSEAVEDVSRNHPNPKHPLLLPIASTWVFENMREADDRAVRLLFLAFFIGLILAAYQLQQIHTGSVAAVLSVSALLLAPFLYSSTRAGASSGYADLIASFYITMSALAMMLWIKEGNRAFVITGAILAACVALTKNEGLVFTFNLFLTTTVFSLFGERSREPLGSEKSHSFIRFAGNSQKFCCLALYVLIVAVVLLPWLCVRSALPNFLQRDYVGYLGYGYIAAGLHKLPEIIKIFVAELLNIRNWSIMWILIVISLAGIGRRWKRESYFIFVLMMLQLTSYLAAVVVTPDDPAAQMSNSLPRLLLHVLPLGVTLVSFQVADIKKIFSDSKVI